MNTITLVDHYENIEFNLSDASTDVDLDATQSRFLRLFGPDNAVDSFPLILTKLDLRAANCDFLVGVASDLSSYLVLENFVVLLQYMHQCNVCHNSLFLIAYEQLKILESTPGECNFNEGFNWKIGSTCTSF